MNTTSQRGHIAEQSTCPHELINQTATQQCEDTIPMFDALSEKYGNAVAFDFSCSLMYPQPPADFKSFADYLAHLVQAEEKLDAEDPIQF
jgi:hypothetical protein|tara:strand:- start:3414 stop:3683 length:270 start_codon:yes stop_codon:yes gene_type:complete